MIQWDAWCISSLAINLIVAIMVWRVRTHGYTKNMIILAILLLLAGDILMGVHFVKIGIKFVIVLLFIQFSAFIYGGAFWKSIKTWKKYQKLKIKRFEIQRRRDLI